MKSSPEIGALAAALSKAQGVIAAAPKDKANPFFNSRYADLASVWGVLRAPLSANGLSVVQGFTAPPQEGTVVITTRLMHSGGQWLESELHLTPKDASPQAAGSCITYGRRYALAAIAGVVSDEDDDGNAATQQGRQTSKPPEKPPVKLSTTSKSTYDNTSTSDRNWLLKEMQSRGINPDQYKAIAEAMVGNPRTGPALDAVILVSAAFAPNNTGAPFSLG